MTLSKNSKIITGIVLVILFAPLGWDLYRKFSHSGIYRRDCRGTVISTGRTVMGYLDIFDCSGSRRERRHRRRMNRDYDLRGHYTAKIQDEVSGKTVKVSISGEDYWRAQPGQYLVCKGSRRELYPSKEQAESKAPAPTR